MSSQAGVLRALFGEQAGAFAAESLPEGRILEEGTIDRLPQVMRSGDLSSFRRLCQVYGGSLYMAGGPPGELRQVRVEGPRAEQIVAMGLTAYFYDVLSSVPSVRDWRRQLGSELGIPASTIRCAAWASPNAAGLDPHFDQYDGIIIQIAGQKLYRIGPNLHIKQSARQWSPRQSFDLLDVNLFDQGIPPEGPPRELEEVLLKPGSVLFLPRGYWHGTKASDESFSLSIRLDPPILADIVLAQLRYALIKDEEWRRPAYGAWAETEQRRGSARRRLERQLAALPAALSRLSADSAFTLVAESSDQFKHVTSATQLCRVWTKELVLERASGSASKPPAAEATLIVSVRDIVSFGLERFEVSASSEPILKWLGASRGVFTVGDLETRFPAFAPDDLRMLLQMLAHKGAIAVIPFRVD